MNHLGLMLGFSFFNYLANLFNSGPGLIYPTLVLNFCGSDASAYFYIAWMMAMVLNIIPVGMSQSLFATGSQRPQELQSLARRSLGLSLLLSSVGLGAMLMAGGWFLGVFGSDYYEHGSKLLWILSASVLPQCINTSFLAINQVQKKTKLITAQAGLTAAIALGLGVLLLKKTGPEGLAWGYLTAHLVVALLVLRPLLSNLTPAKGTSDCVKSTQKCKKMV
jgi:O-antigen/teichoic acid export membrane protein